METVLLTGATGLLGQQITASLISKGYKVFVLKRENSNTSILKNQDSIQWLTIDNEFQFNIDELPQHIDYVIHAAAMVSYLKKDKQQIFRTNVDWTIELAELALQKKAKRFIFISSIAALGKAAKGELINENTPVSKNHFITNYGLSKIAAEKGLYSLAKKGLPLITLSPSVIIGPAETNQSSAQLIGYIMDEKPFYTQGNLNYVDVRDVVTAIETCLKHPAVINEKFVLNAGTTSYKAFFIQVAKKLKKRAPFIVIARSLVIFGAILENIWSKLMSKNPLITTETAKMAGSTHIYDGSKSEKILDMKYRKLEDSLNWTISQMVDKNLI